jgi:hypothetical protein
VDESVIVEFKAREKLESIHVAQLLTHLNYHGFTIPCCKDEFFAEGD